MKTLLISAAFAAAVIAPSAASAQAIPTAVVAVVDLERVSSQCNACKTAQASLQGQLTALQNRQKALAAPLETEGKAIQAAVDALGGKQPDAALKTRAQNWEARRSAAAEEISRQQQQLQANGQYVNKQVMDKLGPIYQQVMQRRGANLLVSSDATLATSTSVDVTNDILAALNAALPTISTTAPAAPKPQGR